MFNHELFSCNYIIFNLKGFQKWIGYADVKNDARPFLRPEKFFVFHPRHSDSVRVGGGERGKRHGFDIGDIHGTAAGNLFHFFRGSGASFFIC
jgi:hypothetical protein